MAEGPGRRCPNCGALLGEDAEWCGQCFADLRVPRASRTEPEPRIEVPVGVTGAERPNGHAPDGKAIAAETPAADPSDAGWPCGICGRRNAMEVSVCLSCGTPFGRGYEEPGEAAGISSGSAVRWSLVYPGLGHWKAGRRSDAIARAIVFTWPLVTGLLFLSAHPSGRLGAIGALGMLSLAAAVLLYIATAIDAGRVAEGLDPMVSRRALLWIAAGIVLFSVASAAVIGISGMSTLKGNG